MHHPIPQTAGIDIAKDRLDVCLCPDGTARHFPNDAKGHRALVVWLSSHAIQRVVFEPTGAYHRTLERSLATAGLRLAKVNPRHTRRFAEALAQSESQVPGPARTGKAGQSRPDGGHAQAHHPGQCAFARPAKLVPKTRLINTDTLVGPEQPTTD